MRSKAAARDGWTRVRFGDIAEQINDRVDDPNAAGVDHYVGLEHLDPGSLRVTRWGSPDEVSAQKLRFQCGDIIFGKRRAYQRKVAVADFGGICSAHAMVLRERPEALATGFLIHFMASDVFMERAVQISVGSLSPTINWSTLRDQEFDLPSIDEQRRAISALGSTSFAREAISRACYAATVLRDSCRDSLCALPEHATSARLETVCQMQNGKAFPGGEYCDKGIRLLRPGNLAIDGTLSWEASKTTHLPFEWLDKAGDYVVMPGDVLINLTAQSLEDGFMGRVCLAGGEDQCLLNQRIGRFIVDANRMLPTFLYRCLQTTRFKMHAIANCEGSKVKHLFWSHLAKFTVPLPPIEEQVRIVEHLAVLDNSCLALATRQASVMTLHKQLLARVS